MASRSKSNFTFDPAAFMEGTKHMSASQRGAYMAMLCHQWIWGHIPKSRKEIQRIAGLDAEKPDDINDLRVVMKKYVLVSHVAYPGGVYMNLRLEQERRKRESTRMVRSEVARQRWEREKEIADIAERVKIKKGNSNVSDENQDSIKPLSAPHKTINPILNEHNTINSKNDVLIILSFLKKELDETTWVQTLAKTIDEEIEYPLRKWKAFSEVVLSETENYIEQSLTYSDLFRQTKSYYTNWLKLEKQGEFKERATITNVKPINGFREKRMDEW